MVVSSGCTRDSFSSQPVTHLAYTTYAPLALRTLLAIATEQAQKHGLVGIAITHRLGLVDVGQESIYIAVSTPHRKAAWLAGEETLEEVDSWSGS